MTATQTQKNKMSKKLIQAVQDVMAHQWSNNREAMDALQRLIDTAYELARLDAPLTRTELHQLLDYAQHCENDGWYWGNAAQFRKRHDKLKDWLNAQIDAAA